MITDFDDLNRRLHLRKSAILLDRDAAKAVDTPTYRGRTIEFYEGQVWEIDQVLSLVKYVKDLSK